MKFTKEKYVEKPPIEVKPVFTGLGVANETEALTQRFIFPSDAAVEHLSNLRAIAEIMIRQASAAERSDFELLAPKIVSKVIRKTYGGERLAPSLYEYAYGREFSDARSIIVALHGARQGNKVLEVGYRSTRLDPHGKPITKPRVYLGIVRAMDEETILLDTAYGIRRLQLKNLAWAVVTPAKSTNLSGLELRVAGTSDAPSFSMHIMRLDEIVKDEPREVFVGEDAQLLTASNTNGGLRKIPINHIAVRLLLPYFNKEVYIEAYNSDGKQWYSGFSWLKRGFWIANSSEPKLTLFDENNEKMLNCTRGYLLVGLPEELPENNL